MAYDVAKIREEYPALSDGRAWLDNAAGTQVPRSVIDAVADTYRLGVSNEGGPFESSRRASRLVAEARAAVADLLGAPGPECVVFGPSMTAMTYHFASMLSAQWEPGDEIVVTQLDHDANVRPWVRQAEKVGARVRMAPLDPATGELPVTSVTELLTERTKLVALPAASNLLGTVPDVSTITARARAAGAVSYVDGVHHCPHADVRLSEWGADFYACSAYKWSGPHVSCVVTADPTSWERLSPETLLTAPESAPECFELGTRPFPALAGVVAAVEHLAGLDSRGSGGRAERLRASRLSAIDHEKRLAEILFRQLASLEGVVRYGTPRNSTATVLFGVPGTPASTVAEFLSGHGINVSHGHAYAWEAVQALGIGEAGGVRASLCHYSDEADVRRLLTGLSEFAA